MFYKKNSIVTLFALFAILFVTLNGLSVNCVPVSSEKQIEATTLKIFTLKPEISSNVTVVTRAPALRRLDDADKSDSPMYMIKSLNLSERRKTKKRNQKMKQDDNHHIVVSVKYDDKQSKDDKL